MPGIPQTWLEEFNVASTGASDPDIIQLANGNILVAWTSTDPARPGASGNNDIIGQIYDPMGNPVGAQFRVNQGFFADDEIDVDLAATTQGGFISVYEDVETGGTPLRFNVYGSNGGLSFTGTIASDSNGATQPNYRDPHVAVSSSTSALVVYQFQDAGGTRIAGRIVDPSTGTVGAEISLIGFSLNESAPDVAVLSNGNYVITCVDFTGGDNRIAYRVVTATGGNVVSASFIASTSGDGFSDAEPTVTALAGGGFAIAYTDSDANDTDVTIAIFNAAGTQTGTANVILPNSGTNLTNEPSITALSDGSFIVIVDDDQAGSDNMVATHYSATGVSLGNFVFSGPGTDPSVTDLGDGRFAVTWQSLDATGGVRMEILDTRDFVNATAAYNPEPNWQVGTIGDDVFTTDSNADIVHGYRGNDTITQASGSGGTNEYFGDAGNDRLKVGTLIDSDEWDGGANTDTLDLSLSTQNGLKINLALGTIVLGAATEIAINFENVDGSNQADTITGNIGVNILKGLGGNDKLDGGANADTMFGGAGNDTYTVDNAGDIASEAGGTGTDTVRSSLTFRLDGVQILGDVERLTLTGNANINGVGNALANLINGNDARNTLKGLDGNDTLNGNDGNDALDGGTGNDTMNGGIGNDKFYVDSSSDKVLEAVGEGTDTVLTTATFTLKPDVEVERLQVKVRTTTNSINLTGNEFGQTIIGNDGVNRISGNGGVDKIYGFDAADFINGGLGNDRLDGGLGNDIFVFDTALPSNRDTIVDFHQVAGDNDSFRIDNAIFTELTSTGTLSTANFRANSTGTAVDGNDFIVYNTSTGELSYDSNGNAAGGVRVFAILSGAPTLAASDFVVF
jgi:Ca2+-binding RTX toxin-like protein